VRRFSLDSNILIYAEGAVDARRRDIAVAMIFGIGPERIVLPMQTTGETLRWMIRKGGFSRADASRRVLWWMDLCRPAAVSIEAFRSALRLSTEHEFQIWDAVILAVSAEAEVEFLLSEDMQHGFRWSGVTIVNPFILAPEQRAELAAGRIRH
jgi:predicted nucleic acid-binding protein